ncbi:MAG: archaeosortase/exosortase family protein [Candidatus Hydrogenedentes bacterium]|nr:archaeosortase/exosortase family protein [Candidatus Hydrogenedentota bacterium]
MGMPDSIAMDRPRERPQSEGDVLAYATVILLAGVPIVAACWGAGLHAWDRWTKGWGSPLSAYVFVGAVFLVWITPLTAFERLDLRLGFARGWALAASSLLCAYACLFTRVPQLVSCELAAAALACTLLGLLPDELRCRSWGIGILLLLSMHVSTSVEFFVGYPLRFVSTWIAALMLGPMAQSFGTALTDGINVYQIDAPCSGVKMLTSALVMGAALSVLLRLRPRATLALVAAAGVIAVLGNAHRAATLFVIGAPDTEAHAVIGVIVFAECAAVLVGLGAYMKRRELRRGQGPRRASPSSAAGPRTLGLLGVACVLASIAPLLAFPVSDARAATDMRVNWPDTWQGHALHPLPLSEAVQKHLRGFPGQWAQFTVEGTGQTLLLRTCTAATRDLHSAENCYLAMGGRCEALPSVRDTDGHVWSRFRYVPPTGGRLEVQQCYFSVSGESSGGALEDWIRGAPSWPDISAWYWAAARPGSPVRTTLAVTVAE